MESECFEVYKELVSEVTKGMERVKQLRASFSVNQDTLLDRMVASHEEALSILTGNAPEVQCQSVISSVSDPPDPSVSVLKVTQPGAYKRRRSSMEVTVMCNKNEALDDGYAWRMYGQKELLNSKYPRSYFKCNVARGCPARKHVQRSQNDDRFLVRYEGVHTCEGAIQIQRSEDGELYNSRAGILPQLGISQYIMDSQPVDEPVQQSLSSKNSSVI